MVHPFYPAEHQFPPIDTTPECLTQWDTTPLQTFVDAQNSNSARNKSLQLSKNA
jgi:hypothetical protein